MAVVLKDLQSILVVNDWVDLGKIKGASIIGKIIGFVVHCS